MDNFKAGRRIPTCQLKVVCTQKENPVDLDYKLNLLGARKPYNFMYFSISPGSRGKYAKMFSIWVYSVHLVFMYSCHR